MIFKQNNIKVLEWPDFLGIGARKSGTSWLYYNLGKHPEIYFPPIKEIHYFDRLSKMREKSLNEKLFDRLLKKNGWWYRCFRDCLQIRSLKRTQWYLRYLFGSFNDRWYASLFEEGIGKLKGEITPAYSVLDQEAVAHIYKLMPDLKIIYIMRNPIDRAWSHFKHDASLQQRPLNSFSDDEIMKHFTSPDSLSAGDYLRNVENWRTFFGQHQMLTVYFDEIMNNPKQFILKIFNFLGLNNAESFANKVYKGKIHESLPGNIPMRLKDKLIDIYYPKMIEFSKAAGGYPTRWLEEIKQVRL